YSHTRYDILEGEVQSVRRPDVLIIEGLNVLQTGGAASTPFVSDFFNYSIYVDASEEDLESWFIERFFALRATAFQSPDSFFHHFAELGDEQAGAVAREIWRSINLVNLHDNILPTRERAKMVLEKGHDHAVQAVRISR
ncbi:MAG: type I pantothenate kinase, partial [Acidimicrobiales bacterium]